MRRRLFSSRLGKRVRAAFLGTVLAMGLLSGLAPQAWSQTYPTKPVRLIVPHPPGGGTDIAARLVGQKLSDLWKQPVVVENRSGAGGNIGAEVVARAAPDGYTLLVVADGTITANVSLYAKVPFDPVKDFAPIAIVAPVQYALVVPASSPAKSVGDLVALSRSRPQGLSFASGSVGSTSHLTGELLKMLTGGNFMHVAYKGTGPALLDVMAGNVDMMFADIVASRSYVTSGKVRALGIASRARSPVAPELKPIADSGQPGIDVMGWTGLLAPAGTPDAVVKKINADVLKVLQQPDVREKLAIDGSQFPDNSPDSLALRIKTEIEKWRKLITASGAKAE